LRAGRGASNDPASRGVRIAAMLYQTRRTVLAGAIALVASPAAAATYPASLAFSAIRNGKRIGEHRLTFEAAGRDLTVRVRAELAIKLGPVTVYRYLHEVLEEWREGRFVRLESRTSSNGARESVVALRTAGAVTVQAGGKRLAAPVATLPFTHWNPEIVGAPLFNPQTGKLLKLSARDLGESRVTTARGEAVQARRVAFRGDAEIDNWYDGAGAWVGLRGRLDDGSTMEYRRL
jgi:hypothetical protein